MLIDGDDRCPSPWTGAQIEKHAILPEDCVLISACRRAKANYQALFVYRDRDTSSSQRRKAGEAPVAPDERVSTDVSDGFPSVVDVNGHRGTGRVAPKINDSIPRPNDRVAVAASCDRPVFIDIEGFPVAAVLDRVLLAREVRQNAQIAHCPVFPNKRMHDV